jgi:flavin-dependent dehydrogenase
MSITPPPDDAIVVGGGPAGATAARLLASWGHRVTLLTRPSARQTLAEALPPSGVHVLGRIGVRERVLDAGFVRATGNTVWWGNEPERVEAFPPGSFGLQVQRTAFDRLLVDAAVNAGVRLLDGASARDVFDVADGAQRTQLTTVRYELAEAAHHLTAQWVLDCSGRAGALSRDMRVSDTGARTTALVGIWERERRWPIPDWTHTTVESSTEGWAWSIPVSTSRRYVTVMLDPELSEVRGGVALRDSYDRALERCPRHAELVRGAALAEPPFAVDATPYHTERVARAGMLVVGDAASFVDPLASFGVKKALASAWLAAVVVHTALTQPSMMGPSLELFERWERESHAALRATVGEFARMAGAAPVAPNAGPSTSVEPAYWQQRVEERVPEVEGSLDARAMRVDPDVLHALADIRARDRILLRMSSSCTIVPRPTVQGRLVVLEDHLQTPRLSPGARYVRNVDLLHLAQISLAHDQVPDILDAYNRQHHQAPLPDLLGALAVLVAKGVLDIA